MFVQFRFKHNVHQKVTVNTRAITLIYPLSTSQGFKGTGISFDRDNAIEVYEEFDVVERNVLEVTPLEVS